MREALEKGGVGVMAASGVIGGWRGKGMVKLEKMGNAQRRREGRKGRAEMGTRSMACEKPRSISI